MDTGRCSCFVGTSLYDAKVYIGEDHFADAEQYAQDIVDGKYGTYAVADRWDAAF